MNLEKRKGTLRLNFRLIKKNIDNMLKQMRKEIIHG